MQKCCYFFTNIFRYPLLGRGQAHRLTTYLKSYSLCEIKSSYSKLSMLQVKLTQTSFLPFYIRDRHSVFAVFQWISLKRDLFFGYTLHQKFRTGEQNRSLQHSATVLSDITARIPDKISGKNSGPISHFP